MRHLSAQNPLLILILLLFLSFESADSQRSLTAIELSKHKSVSEAIGFISNIDRLAIDAHRKNPDRDIGAEVRKQISALVLKDRRIESLRIKGLFLKSVLKPQAIETRRYDQVVETALWASIKAIAAFPGHEAAVALDELSWGMHGADKLTIKSYISRQRSLTSK